MSLSHSHCHPLVPFILGTRSQAWVQILARPLALLDLSVSSVNDNTQQPVLPSSWDCGAKRSVFSSTVFTTSFFTFGSLMRLIFILMRVCSTNLFFFPPQMLNIVEYSVLLPLT